MLVWCWEGMIMFQWGDSFIDITGVQSSELLVNSLVGRWKLFLSIVPYQHFLKTSLWLAHDDLSCLDLTAKYLFNRQQNNSMTSNLPICMYFRSISLPKGPNTTNWDRVNRKWNRCRKTTNRRSDSRWPCTGVYRM